MGTVLIGLAFLAFLVLIPILLLRRQLNRDEQPESTSWGRSMRRRKDEKPEV